jgi:hypothetical protein
MVVGRPVVDLRTDNRMRLEPTASQWGKIIDDASAAGTASSIGAPP